MLISMATLHKILAALLSSQTRENGQLLKWSGFTLLDGKSDDSNEAFSVTAS
jgi:hypothetical protein